VSSGSLYFSALIRFVSQNWIQTLPNHGLLVAVRLYGAGAAFYDQTWKPDDVAKI
jgi:hypothetical protein